MPRARQLPLGLDYETFDGTNASVIAAFAGSQYEGSDENGRPWIRGTDGVRAVMQPGWVISRADGSPGVTVSAPAAWAERVGETPEQS